MLGPRPKGIGRYVWELCKALDRVLPDARFVVYSREPIVPVPDISPRWRWRCDLSPAGARVPNSLWGVFRLGFIAQRDNLDVFWGGTGLLPLAGLKARTVLTVHDFVYKLAPETMSTRSLWATRLFLNASIRHADEIVSNSCGTAHRLQAIFGRKVAAVVQPGLTEAISPKAAIEVQAILQRFGIRRPYLLSVGTREPRKGLDRLVPAFIRLLEQGQLRDHCLVLAGDRGWKDEAITRLVESHERIHPLGFVDDDSLSAFYSGAAAFVFPSSYEGFGMPVLEARACGTRVVTTDIPELREAGGEDAIYIPPTLEGICDGILRALQSDHPKPLNHTDYSWVKSATVFARVLADSPSLSPAMSA
jgi:glycosyltransferase involved in cell wall biosynthesis